MQRVPLRCSSIRPDRCTAPGGNSGFGSESVDDDVEDAFGLLGTGSAGPDPPEEPHEHQDVNGVEAGPHLSSRFSRG
jgi:hypothetical protein